MSDIIKAGVPHPVVVNSKADKIGFEAGFRMHYINAATNAVTDLPVNSFSEIEKDIVATSTTTSNAQNTGDNVITVADATGFGIGETVLLGGNYYRISDVTGNDITFKRGLDGDVSAGSTFDLNGRTGSYVAMVTFPTAGDFTGHVSNPSLNMDNEAFPIRVGDATVDDVKNAITALQTDISSVKTQIDLLDETTVNGISAQVTSVANDLSAVHTLIKDTSDVYVEIAGDETSNITIDDTLTGDTSGAVGTVQYVTYDATADITKVTMQSVTGTFQTGETVNNGTTSTTGTISDVQNNVVNSVIEFVDEIKSLLDSGSGLDALKGLNKDLEHMINGDALLEDGSTCPTAGKGLSQTFDELVLTHADVTGIKTLAEDANYGFSALKTAVVDSRTSIENKIDSLVNTGDANSLVSKIDAVKVIVDANKALLEDGTNGLASIMTGVNDVKGMFANGGTAELRFSAIDNAITTLGTALDSQTTHIDSRFDSVISKLSDMDDSRTYTVFA